MTFIMHRKNFNIRSEVDFERSPRRPGRALLKVYLQFKYGP
jgi:hypothetical protein